MEETKPTSITKVPKTVWDKAQEYESHHMVFNNRKNGYLKLIFKFIKALKNPRKLLLYLKFKDFYCGDDWNYWWMKQFDNYSVLPKHFEKSLEVGSGPYSNMRIVSQLVNVKEMYFTDPLMHLFTAFRMTWISDMAAKKKIHVSTGKAEQIDFPDQSFDLVVCNNVLDHVENAEQCLSEMHRVLKPGGYIIFGQELTNNEDLKVPSWRDDQGHPIKLHETFLDEFFEKSFDASLKKILPREQSRVPHHNYGTYIYIGKKK